MIGLGMYREKYPDFVDWDSASRGSASGLVNELASFEFCICLSHTSTLIPGGTDQKDSETKH